MDRVEKLRVYIDEVLLNMTDTEERRCAYVHLYGVSFFAAMIALKRGEDPELATIAGMLHDFYTYSNLDETDHAHKGAPLAEQVLRKLDITSSEETVIIYSAIYNHSDKAKIDSPFDEVLKDADVLQHCLYNVNAKVKPHEIERFNNLKIEFGF